MKALLLFTKGTENERTAVKMADELTVLRVESELIDLDSPNGAAMRELYQVMGEWALMLARDDGSLVEAWQEYWPGAIEISYRYHLG